MQAPKYVESNLEALRYRDYSFQLHQQKLQRIRERAGRADGSPSGVEKMQRLRVKTTNYLEAERLESIKRENKSLMVKLLCISEAKAARRTLRSLEPRSLNTHLRKKEEERIRLENEAISKRLQEKEALLSKKQMDHDYFQSLKYRRQISRAHLLKIQKRTQPGVSLPPLSEAESGTVSSSQKRLDGFRSTKAKRDVHGLLDGLLNRTFHPSLSATNRDRSKSPGVAGMTLDKYIVRKSAAPLSELNGKKKTRLKKSLLEQSCEKSPKQTGEQNTAPAGIETPLTEKAPTQRSGESKSSATVPIPQHDTETVPMPVIPERKPTPEAQQSDIAKPVSPLPEQPQSTSLPVQPDLPKASVPGLSP